MYMHFYSKNTHGENSADTGYTAPILGLNGYQVTHDYTWQNLFQFVYACTLRNTGGEPELILL